MMQLGRAFREARPAGEGAGREHTGAARSALSSPSSKRILAAFSADEGLCIAMRNRKKKQAQQQESARDLSGAGASGSRVTREKSGYQPPPYFNDFGAIAAKVQDDHDDLQWRSVQFDAVLFGYNVAHLFIQNANIYRTNLHNYNFNLIFITIIFLSKRIITLYLTPVSRASGLLPMRWEDQFLKTITVPFFFVNFFYLLVQLFIAHPFHVFVWLIVPFIAASVIFKNVVHAYDLPSGPERSVFYFKTAMFRAFESTFFTGLLPIVFIEQKHLYYDTAQCCLIVVFILANVSVLLGAQLFVTRYTELSLQVQVQGGWAPLKPGTSMTGATAWTAKQTYARGAVVSHRGCYYSALEDQNMVEPGALAPRLVAVREFVISRRVPDLLAPSASPLRTCCVKFLFTNPARTYFLVAVVQAALVASELAMLVFSYSLRCWFTYRYVVAKCRKRFETVPVHCTWLCTDMCRFFLQYNDI
jgi:hypothetical protein